MTRWLSYFDPNGRASGRRRTAAAIGLSALVVGPTFVLLLIGLLSIADVTVLMRMKVTAMLTTLAKSLIYGLIGGLPTAAICATLIGMLARRGWDAIGVSLSTGIIASTLPAACLIYFALERVRGRVSIDPELWWQWPVTMVPFALTGAVMCALFWWIAIRHRRHARLTALHDAAAIRAME
jgi:hypothetical protein